MRRHRPASGRLHGNHQSIILQQQPPVLEAIWFKTAATVAEMIRDLFDAVFFLSTWEKQIVTDLSTRVFRAITLCITCITFWKYSAFFQYSICFA